MKAALEATRDVERASQGKHRLNFGFRQTFGTATALLSQTPLGEPHYDIVRVCFGLAYSKL